MDYTREDVDRILAASEKATPNIKITGAKWDNDWDMFNGAPILAEERWQSMKAIYDVCCKADVTIPEEVLDFFDNEPPDEAGVEVDIDEAVRGWSDDSREGFEVDLTKLPDGVKILRFYNSY